MKSRTSLYSRAVLRCWWLRSSPQSPLIPPLPLISQGNYPGPSGLKMQILCVPSPPPPVPRAASPVQPGSSCPHPSPGLEQAGELLPWGCTSLVSQETEITQFIVQMGEPHPHRPIIPPSSLSLSKAGEQIDSPIQRGERQLSPCTRLDTRAAATRLF